MNIRGIFYSLAPFAFTIVIFALAVFIGISGIIVMITPDLSYNETVNIGGPMPAGGLLKICAIILGVLVLLGLLIYWGFIPKNDWDKEVLKK